MTDEPSLNDENLQCPFCRAENPPGSDSCAECGRSVAAEKWMAGTVIESDTIDTGPEGSIEESSPESSREPSAFESMASPDTLEPGTVLADRYRIERLLGFGGMGSVYKARDLELDRVVALKVIRPHLADDPNILQRFKQEIILSREVTHRNVVRIFDLGQADDTRFISMEFVEGRDLLGLLKERGALPVEEAAEIIEQICLALDAAHQQGVVHRDLKPANIMIAPDGRVVVMDFGIARSLEISGMTQTGSVLGTPDYMSPEQVKGEPVDARSDLFALGIIFYQLLTGELPYKAATPMAAMYKRTQNRAAPVRDLNPDLPGFLGDVVSRCLEIPIPKRYQSAREILQDLTVWRGGSTHMSLVPTMRGIKPSTTAARKRFRFAAIGGVAAVAIALVVAGVFWLRGRDPAIEGGRVAPAPADVVSLAILPFENASGDEDLAWLESGLAEMLRTDVGQTASLRTVSSNRLHQVFKDLRITSDTALEEATLRRVAEFANADTVVWGQFARIGEQIRIDATLRDFERHETAALKAEAANEQQLLRAVQELAQGVRDNLALSGRAVRELEEQAFLPSASSVVALRHYNEGLDLMRQGNNLDAVTAFETAIGEDEDFALAYSKLSQAYFNLGRGQRAEESSRAAVDLSGDLPTQERYLILAQNARVEGDYEAGVDAYENLLQTRPSDAELNYEIALLHEQGGSLDLARQHLETALDTDPQNPVAQLAMGRVLIKSGETQDALAPLNQALSLAIQSDNHEARANTLQAIGIAYRILGRPEEAMQNYRQSLEIKREIDDQRGMSASLSEIGLIQSEAGDADAARSSFEEAIAISREIGDSNGLARNLQNLGEVERTYGNHEGALLHTREALRIQMEIGDVAGQARSLNSIGAIYDARGEYGESLVYYQRALELQEQIGDPGGIGNSLHNIAETNMYMGRYDQAVDFYMRALEVSREAADEWAAAIELYSLGRVYGLQGRYGAALASIEGAVETFRRIEDTGSGWYAEILAGYGNALSLLGRFDEADPVLEEALELARQYGDPLPVALTINYQGGRQFYSGDFESARDIYRQAVAAAEEAGDPYLILAARADLARAELASGRPQRAIPMIEETVREAQSRGAKYLETRCSTCLGSALLATNDAAGAEQRFRAAIAAAEDMGSLDLLAQNHHRLAAVLSAQGDTEDASRHASKASEYLAQIRSEAGSETVLERADLKPVADATPAD